MNSASLNKRCERTLPILDAAAAVTSLAVGVGLFFLEAAVDEPEGLARNVGLLSVGTAALFGITSSRGFTRVSECRRRQRVAGTLRNVTIDLAADEDVATGTRRAYESAAAACAHRGFALVERSMPSLRRLTIVYRCQ